MQLKIQHGGGASLNGRSEPCYLYNLKKSLCSHRLFSFIPLRKMFKLHIQQQKILTDTTTPVGLYLRIRDRFAQACLLESSDYHGEEDSFSFIGMDPIASISIKNHEVKCHYPDGCASADHINGLSATQHLENFKNQFKLSENQPSLNHPIGGLFGFSAYDAVRYYEGIEVEQNEDELGIPDICYFLFRYVIAIDHFKNESYLYELHLHNHLPKGFKSVEQLIYSTKLPSFSFETKGDESTHLTDQAFTEILQKGQERCFRGDVFQIVLSRRYNTPFAGDEFNVYRALRSINPSPYLFYFDFGSFKIFGSSPEAQLVVKQGKATIHPIAGTFKRTGHDAEDAALAQQLANDPKENAEHTMLVDLARNDLSTFGDGTKVEVYKEVQYFSHVIHLVSKVSASIDDRNALQLAASTFPAGTLSGAPKVSAMHWINQYEPVRRNAYGGAIGFLGFDNSINQAIIIRSFVSKNNKLHYQAGAGVVAKSDIPSELQEVHNKLSALRQALKRATEL